MITNSQDYERFLSNIAETAPSVLKMRLPINESIYSIDLNTRKISAPPFIGVSGDHTAEYVFFEMDRYYDMMDLSETIGLVLFKNAHGENFYQLIPYYDIYSIDGKIIFPWAIQAPAALYSGNVSFSFKFFKVNPTSQKLVYELNTLVAKTKVLVGWSDFGEQAHTYNILDSQSITGIVDDEIFRELSLIVSSARYGHTYWIDLEENNISQINEEDYVGKHMLNAALPHQHGIYRNGQFYSQDNKIIAGVTSIIYIDDNTKNFYYYDGSNFVLIDSES